MFGVAKRELSRHVYLKDAKEAAGKDSHHKLKWKKTEFLGQDGKWHVEYASDDAQVIKLEPAEEAK